MYITINNIKGEKRIDLSYSIQNFDSDKEIAVIRTLSDNVQYQILKLHAANLSFNIELTSAVDANRTLVSKIGRAIIKKLAVKFEGNEIMSVDNFDVLPCY